METLLLALILGLVPFAGLFGCNSRGLRIFWAALVVGEAFACGWVLSMFASSMAGWNRYGEPDPPYILATVFAVVASLVALPIAMYQPKMKPEQ